MLKITLFSLLSMGLGFLDLGCSENFKILVMNQSDTTCVIKLKMKKNYSQQSFMNEIRDKV